jgi:hypothetical protein
VNQIPSGNFLNMQFMGDVAFLKRVYESEHGGPVEWRPA